MSVGNAIPQFCKNGNLGSPPPSLTAASAKSDGTGTIGTDIFLAMTADATFGSLVEYVRFMLTATTASTSSTATVARVFASSVGSGAVTAANTHLLGEVALPITVGASPTAASNPIDLPLNIRLPAGWFLLVSVHAAPAANTAWKAIAVSGDF